MSCLACSTILWQKWVLHTTIQPFSFSLYQCNTHIYILDKATEGFFHILLIASAHFGFNLFWKTICGKCLWMHEWNNHRKQKSCLCQFTLLTATDRSWKQKIKTKITQATSCGPSEVGSQSSFTPSPPQHHNKKGMILASLHWHLPRAVAVKFDLTEGLDVGIKACVSVLCVFPQGFCVSFIIYSVDEVKVKPAFSLLVHLAERG